MLNAIAFLDMAFKARSASSTPETARRLADLGYGITADAVLRALEA